MQDLGGESRVLVLIEDAAKNLPPARRRGWRTIWLRSTASWLAANFGATPASPDEVEADVILDDLVDVGVAIDRLLDGRA
jgi:hypothetical protein